MAGATGVSSAGAADIKRRRRAVEERLRAAGPPRVPRRTPPPEGRLGADERAMRAFVDALADLGPLFGSFGRYLSTRVDLLGRRDSVALAALPDRGEPLTEEDVSAAVDRELGAPLDQRYFTFDFTARRVSLWTEQHDAWLSPGVPVVVTIVRPDAADILASDLPLLPLLAPWLGLTEAAIADAVDDFSGTLRQRLDQIHQAGALAKLAADRGVGGLFDAPGTYRGHCAAGILTRERLDGITIDDVLARRAELSVDSGVVARRLATAWLRQAIVGQIVPYELDPRDVLLVGDRFLLLDGAFEPQTASGRAGFLHYINAAAADDPDLAADWLLGAADALPDRVVEEEVRRRLRQAVPFRDGEWSGEDRLAEQMLVHWRVVRQGGWRVTAHHVHLYRGIHVLSAVTTTLAAESDALLAALQEERLRAGFGTAQSFVDPRAMPAMFDKLLQDMVHLPQKLDQVLTQAADGRIRVKLNVPADDQHRRTRNRTVALVCGLVVLTALAYTLRHAPFASTPGVEQIGALAVMAIGAWLLVAAARL